MPRQFLSRGCFSLWLLGAVWGFAPSVQAQLVPGTGNLLNTDDLEDTNWGYVHNFPKSSKEEDEDIRYPLGASNNRMWSESPKRGSPDVVKRVETPPGGLEGSTGSLYLRTRDSGIPGRPGNKQAQDDFILSARPVAVGYSPNFVVRVYLPEFKDWEQRQGVSFGIRAGLQGMMTKQKPASFGKRFFRGSKMESVTEMEPYYPGFFVAFNPVKANPAYKEDHAQILIRSDGNGHEVAGPKITQTGWWTFGMSVTPDSRCHYYAHAGVSDLTAGDHIYSSLPYGIRGDHFNTIFFNVCSADNASSWSTPWIIDDPKVFYSGQAMIRQPQPQQAQNPLPEKTAQVPASAIPAQNASLSKEVPASEVQAPVQSGTPATPLQVPSASPTTPAPMSPALITPAPAPIAPALLSAGPTVSLKPVQPLTVPVSIPLEEDVVPVAPVPLLVPAVEATEPAKPSLESPQVLPQLLQAKPAVAPKSNPFDDTKKPNSQPASVKPVADSGAGKVESPAVTIASPQEEPPLVIPEADDSTQKVDPTPVPAPPTE